MVCRRATVVAALAEGTTIFRLTYTVVPRAELTVSCAD